MASCTTAVVLSASCGGPRPVLAVPTAPCAPSIEAHPDWQLMDRGAFTFRLPPHFRKQPGTGIDSWVESYASEDGDDEVEFDYGQWSSDLRPDSAVNEQYSACVDTIGGKPATIVTLRIRDSRVHKNERPYVAAATWRSLTPSERVATHLTMMTQTRDARRLGDLLAVLRSVRFPVRNGGPGSP